MPKRRREKETRHIKGITRRGFLERGLLITGGIAVSGGIGGYLWNYLIREPELTLENAKRSSDQRFVQAYLDRILATGKVPFQTTEVIYDPDFSKSIEFWKDQLQRYPEHKAKIEQHIETSNKHKLVLERVRRERTESIPLRPGYVAPVAARAKGLDDSTKIFVYDIPYFATTDDDILWQLEHERCHNEIQTRFNFPVPPRYTVKEVQRVAQALIDNYEVEEARCYTHQFRNAGRFDVTRNTYNFVLGGYRIDSYDILKKKAAGDDIESWIIRQLLEREFIDPYRLQPR